LRWPTRCLRCGYSTLAFEIASQPSKDKFGNTSISLSETKNFSSGLRPGTCKFDTFLRWLLYFLRAANSRPEEPPMLKLSLAIFLIGASATFGLAQAHEIHQPKLTPQKSGTTQLLISVSR